MMFMGIIPLLLGHFVVEWLLQNSETLRQKVVDVGVGFDVGESDRANMLFSVAVYDGDDDCVS